MADPTPLLTDFKHEDDSVPSPVFQDSDADPKPDDVPLDEDLQTEFDMAVTQESKQSFYREMKWDRADVRRPFELNQARRWCALSEIKFMKAVSGFTLAQQLAIRTLRIRSEELEDRCDVLWQIMPFATASDADLVAMHKAMTASKRAEFTQLLAKSPLLLLKWTRASVNVATFKQ